ncbi:hypothetical protein D3C79_963270 [compost metagenome]
MPGLHDAFIVTDNAAGDLNRTISVQFSAFYTADYTNITGCSDFKTGQNISSHNDSSNKINVSSTIVNISINFVNREHIELIFIRLRN